MRDIRGVGIALRFQAQRAVVFILAFFASTRERARGTSGVQLYAGQRGVAIHFSARFGVVHSREMLQALAHSIQAVVKIVPVALLQ